MHTPRTPTPPNAQNPHDIHDFTPKSRKNTSLSQHRSDTDGNRADNPNDCQAWIDEFRTHYVVFKHEVAKFLDEYMPSDTPYLVDPSISNVFDGVPLDKLESDMYNPLVRSLNQLTQSFPANRKPTFANTSTATFPPLSKSDHATKPDITITHPNVNTPTASTDWKWHLAASIIEVKPKTSSDPFNDDGKYKDNDTHDKIVVQISKYARNLLQGNSSCFVFLLGVYGHNARIYRFDRSGVIVSKAFNYISSPEHLGEFLWRLVHPENSRPGIIGSDTTITRPTSEEAQRMLDAVRDVVRRHDPTLEIDDAKFLQDSRWMEACWSPLCEGHDSSIPRGRTRCFTIGPPLWQSTNLFSRATVVWRVVIEGHEGKLYALKDSWRELCREPEVFFYERIQKFKGESKWVGLAEFMGSLNLGGEEEMLSRHCTCSATLRGGQGSDLQDRSHVRTLTYPVGHPLSTFTSTRQMVLGLRAAIEGLVFNFVVLKYASQTVVGHRFAFASGVLHRDISSGNILFSDQVVGGGAFLHDLDYSEIVLMPGEKLGSNSESEILRSLKTMTGTYQFMAIDVLMHEMHERKHDLESIYWLLIWIILRHVEHDQGPSACKELFDVEDRKLAAGAKTMWLGRSDLRISNNEPLTELLESLRILFRKQLADKDTSSVEVTYDTLLATIDDALSLPGWPEDDSSIPFKPCSGSKFVKDASEASSGKRKAESRAASMSSKRQKASTSLLRLSMAEYGGDVEQAYSRRPSGCARTRACEDPMGTDTGVRASSKHDGLVIPRATLCRVRAWKMMDMGVGAWTWTWEWARGRGRGSGRADVDVGVGAWAWSWSWSWSWSWLWA
ncbi:hypothetical protein BJV77DRAFT_1073029 [Russula vinacea]|nr:hypothetical protein BJV77DRAFT_1073029 [Russula vinacea]